MKRTYLLAGTSIFFWSTIAVTTKLLLRGYNSFQVLYISAFFAFSFLFITNMVTGNIRKLKKYSKKDYLISVLIGLPGTFLYYLFYYNGTDILQASQAFIINYLWPIMSVIFACIVLKEKMTVRKFLAIIISFVGLCIVTLGERTDINGEIISGSIFCVLGAVAYGFFTALNQKACYDKSISMTINYFVTFVLSGIINMVNNDLLIPNVTELAGFAWNGIFTMAIANTAWIMALELGNTAKISNLAYITPFISLIWTFLILNEKISINFFVGLIVIVLGLFVQLKDTKTTTTVKNKGMKMRAKE